MNKIELSDLNNELGESPELFICNASFETRCLSISEALDKSKLKNALVLWNEDFLKEVGKNLETLEKTFENKTTKIKLRTDKQLESSDILREEVIPLIKNCEQLCVIDITTFTHEHLLILIKLIFELSPSTRIKLLYTGADSYSTNTNEEEFWLSKGVFDIRTILGYSGTMLPSKDVHLIILVGFEVERVEILTSYYEPALVSLGKGRKNQSVRKGFSNINSSFHSKVKAFIEKMVNSDEVIKEFEFSCVEPLETMSDILKEIEKHKDYNTVVCTLNTKPSTIGAALAAIKSNQIQLVYAQPVQYNTKGYSKPSEFARIFDLNMLFNKVKSNL